MMYWVSVEPRRSDNAPRLIWRSRCQVAGGSWRVGARRSAGAVRGSRGGASGLSFFGGDARLIFEGWVPHDPVFVAVRGLEAGAASGRGGRWLPIVASRTARRDEREARWFSRAPRQPRSAVVVCGGQVVRVAASQQNAASSRAHAIATTPAGL